MFELKLSDGGFNNLLYTITSEDIDHGIDDDQLDLVIEIIEQISPKRFKRVVYDLCWCEEYCESFFMTIVKRYIIKTGSIEVSEFEKEMLSGFMVRS